MNFSSLVLRQAELAPERLALAVPVRWDSVGVQEYATRTYGELADDVMALRRGLAAAGLKRGDRVVVMFPLSPDLYSLALALLASGMALVLVDAGMGARRVLQAITDSRAAAIVTVDAVLKYRWLTPALWGLKRFSHEGSSGWGVRPFESLRGGPRESPVVADMVVADMAVADMAVADMVAADMVVADMAVEEMAAEEHALITFTSGTTGRPKGADRNHGLLIAQHEALREHFPERPEDVDMPCFPVVALHNLCCGITTVMPPVDLRAPASVEPAVVLAAIEERGVTRMSGAPAYMRRIAAHMLSEGVRAPSIREVGIGGAVVSRDLCRAIAEAFPDAQAQVIYGSTEAEPMASADMADVAATDGEGHLVGVVAEVANVQLVALPVEPPVLGDDGVAPWAVPAGSVGEVVVSGAHVNRGYLDNPVADRENKLKQPDGVVWHRTGDLGRFDAEGRLWLMGRQADALHLGDGVVYPFPIEETVGRLRGVERAALIRHARAPDGELVLELSDAGLPDDEVLEAVTLILDALELPDVGAAVIERLPVDRRHNSKIDRPALRRLRERGG